MNHSALISLRTSKTVHVGAAASSWADAVAPVSIGAVLAGAGAFFWRQSERKKYIDEIRGWEDYHRRAADAASSEEARASHHGEAVGFYIAGEIFEGKF